jgi:hypothetical protein
VKPGRPAFVRETHHGLRVTIGHGGPAGVLLLCRGTSRDYWKVKLDSGRWVWPDGAVVESSGVYTELCAECHLEFRTDTMNEPICPLCERRMAQAVIASDSGDRYPLKRSVRWRSEQRGQERRRW